MDFIYSVPVSATAACYSIKINNRSSYVTTYFHGKFCSVFKFVPSPYWLLSRKIVKVKCGKKN